MKFTKNLSRFASFLFLIVITNSCKDIDDTITIPSAEDVIQKDDEIYDLLVRVTNEVDDPMTDIVCIDIRYPVNLLIYNSSLQRIGAVTIIGDDNFSAFLGILPADQSLSISYPITTTLADGTEFTVNSNAELKIAIDSCSREDIISYCGGLFCTSAPGILTPCVWKVQYDVTSKNQYLSGYFDVNVDGTIRFFYDNQTYDGSWTFLFVNDELHMNINLEGTSQVATDWNFDRRAVLEGDRIIIQSPSSNIVLKKACQETTAYVIGNIGPGGGIIFCDKGSYTDGWRYAEAAPADLNYFEWGCASSSVANTQGSGIGRGLFNSGAILNFHDGLLNFYSNPIVCSNLNNGSVAAKEALDFNVNGRNDWFLPSENELALLYNNLHLQGLGNFANTIYWSSTENDATTVKTIDFATGLNGTSLKVPPLNTVKVRCIRYF